ncbi:hypothetical protein MIB92_15000 [Aestuariirhabdus sp. Z084]|uniref:hypothetical protein n=1 Tax=Aestuariirhabdus haliotis TaxID=2918751 RepID=UPI00201B42AD|nr:hypothetical protein [Aestuariirhabdus haliotis]MCL6416967.1 hypothetical protein [Aestuariirhabdus haliotis]MCL6421026.1 hypothetical protein [Aestuariirhabdus haliotis]
MNLDQFKLSEDERSLLIEMTDFGVPLYEVLGDVRIAYPDSSSIDQLEIAKRLVYSVIEKGLASLCKITVENTHYNTYEVNDSMSMFVDDIKDLMSQAINWEQSSDAFDSSISYELAPTELGEKVLDEIFNIKHSN